MFEMPFAVVKYIAVGLFIWLLGAVFFGSSLHFESRSEPAQLRVLTIESRRDREGLPQYRPVFVLAGAPSAAQGYAGDTWYKTPPHKVGEVVAGRYDATTGEMRSKQMLRTSVWLGRLAQIFGILVGCQSIAIIFGFPEQLLPLRIRLRGHRRPRQIWQ